MGNQSGQGQSPGVTVLAAGYFFAPSESPPLPGFLKQRGFLEAYVRLGAGNYALTLSRKVDRLGSILDATLGLAQDANGATISAVMSADDQTVTVTTSDGVALADLDFYIKVSRIN